MIRLLSNNWRWMNIRSVSEFQDSITSTLRTSSSKSWSTRRIPSSRGLLKSTDIIQQPRETWTKYKCQILLFQFTSSLRWLKMAEWCLEERSKVRLLPLAKEVEYQDRATVPKHHQEACSVTFPFSLSCLKPQPQTQDSNQNYKLARARW